MNIPTFSLEDNLLGKCNVYPMTVNPHKGPPTERKELRQWPKYIARAEGGISSSMPRKCSSLTQIRRKQKCMALF
jgi:hypothetical protein